MHLYIVGTNYEYADLALREQLSIVADNMRDAIESAYSVLSPHALVILSTCNRTELILLHEQADADTNLRMQHWLSEYKHVDLQTLIPQTYAYDGEQAIVHLIEVASGIDSMVLGEPQIFGQLKSAVASTNAYMNMPGAAQQFFQKIFYFAKKVRTDTAIGENPVSVAYAAVDLSKQVFSDLSEHSALLIGAGETIELVAKHLTTSGIKNIIVANRTLANAQTLADQVSGQAALLSEIPELLKTVDIVVSSTGSQLPILGKGSVESALKKRKHKPYFMLDLAVPRDIEAEVAQLDDVYLYTVDDLSAIVAKNNDIRQSEVSKADQIIKNAVVEIAEQQRSLIAIDTLKAMRQQAEGFRDMELQKAKKMLENGEDIERVLQDLAHGLTNKLIHNPTVELKAAGAQGRKDLLALASQLFGIKQDKDS